MRKILCLLMLFIVTLPASLPMALGSGISAQITKVEYSLGNTFLTYGYLGQLGPGQQVKVRITVKNTGSRSHMFWVGISFRDSKGYWKGHYDVMPQRLTLNCGWFSCDEKSLTFTWTVPSPPNEAHGTISLAAGVWEGFNGNFMVQPQYAYRDWFQIGNSYFQ